MNRLRFAFEAGFSMAAISLLAACGGGGEGDSGGANMPATTGLLQSLTIAPATSSVTACSPVQYTATGKYSDNTTIDVTNGVFWEIDPANSDVAIANALNGQIVGLKAGIATVNAWTGQGIAASAVLNITSETLNTITVAPAVTTAAVGGKLAFAATATCSNGSIDISRMNIWSSGSPTVATISVSGMATAVATSSSVIGATAGAAVASAVLNVQ
ncbi:MAG: hypothetical protein ACM3W8_03895 [Sideroxydans sp.]